MQYCFENIEFSLKYQHTDQVDSGWSENPTKNWHTDCLEVIVEGGAPSTSLPRIFLKDVPSIFGDGGHITTRICLTKIEHVLAERTIGSFFDFGMGCGTLPIAAAVLGVPRVGGCEIDPDALQVADYNKSLNNCSQLYFSEKSPQETFDLVACNIQPPLLFDVKEELLGLLHCGSILILSGFTALDNTLVEKVFVDRKLKMLGESNQSNWVCSVFEYINS